MPVGFIKCILYIDWIILKIYNEYVNRIQSYGALRVKRESGSKPLQPPLL
jgi:hypothetical protein